MKKLSNILLPIIIALITNTSCNQIKDENRIVMKGADDSLLIVQIPDAACNKCQKVIEDGLQNQKGVKQSILNLKTKEVSIVYDPLIISSQILKDTVTELRYKMPCSKSSKVKN